MLFIIILVVVVVFAVGALKEMSPSERTIVIRRTLNIATFGVVYIFRALRGLVRASYQSGRIAGATMAVQGQDTFDSMYASNVEVEEKGGATKEAIRVSISHEDALGFTGMNNDLKAKADALVKEANARRVERDARMAARMAK